jgi:hypothetical protein
MCVTEEDLTRFESGSKGTYLVSIGSIRAHDSLQGREEEMASLEWSRTARNSIGEAEREATPWNRLPAGLAVG